jgi:tRNA A64-2'-O-ribosylphosphate transferase
VDFFPLICISASKLVHEGIERRSAGFTYVQGSGDDHESWSQVSWIQITSAGSNSLCYLLFSFIQGLTPHLYWQNQVRLLSSSRSALPDLFSSLVAHSANEQLAGDASPVPVTRVNSRLAVGTAHYMPSGLALDKNAYVIITSRPLSLSPPTSHNILLLEAPGGKKGQYTFLSHVLPRSLEFLRHHLRAGEDVAILCEDGKDVSVGVAMAALCLFFDDGGTCVADVGAPGTRKLVKWK